MSDDLRIEEIDEAVEAETCELREKLESAQARVVELETRYSVEWVAAHKNKIKILEKQIEVLEAVVRYWKWRAVGEHDVQPGDEYLLES